MSASNQQIIPMLAYEDGIAAMDWLCKVFDYSSFAVDDHNKSMAK